MMRQKGKQIELHAPAFAFRLDTRRGLRAVAWENKLTGKTLTLGNGLEFDCDLDAAEQRIGITGWKGITSELGHSGEDFVHPDCDDSKWDGLNSPACQWADKGPVCYWARTHIFLPADCRGKRLALVLGGFGLYDFRFMRVFVNGHAIGVRHARKRWNEPKAFVLRPRHLRFGQDNIIALQLTGYVTRTKRLDECDPHHGRNLPLNIQWPAQFEQYLVVGKSVATTAWRVKRSSVKAGKAVFELAERKHNLTARVTYRWKSGEPTLQKFVEVTNRSRQDVRLLNVRLGAYRTAARVSEGEQGFPVYVGDQFFATLAHPSGWAKGERGEVRLQQFPGKLLKPGGTFRCMETVLGVALPGAARRSFLVHVRGRMRRTVRGHDRPYAILESFGAWKKGNESWFADLEPTEKFLLQNIRHVAAGQKKSQCHFDLYSIEFWVDYAGDIALANRKRFPHQFQRIKRALDKLGTKLALWIDSSMAAWTIGENPAISPCVSHDPSYGTSRPMLCRASEPVNTLYSTGLRHHIRENGARLFKFDNLSAICYNPQHAHLPGVYSTEAIHNAIIEMLRDLDRESRDVFLMLYWGYRSPWWLVHADTVFECGLEIEASHPGDSPTLYVRDSITQSLDQGQWYCEDLPLLGKDSLGVWLSNWGWNSSVGTERWQEGFVMDLCRGSLLAQPWSDEKWLNPAGRRQMAEFIALLKAQPACFANPQFIIGNPWRDEPYGYSCSDGQRTFLALNNCTWQDQILPVDAHGRDIYRWYPRPARLTGDSTRIVLRPFEVVLLEVVPAGQAPSLRRRFPSQPIPQSFAESSRALPVTARRHGAPLRLPIEDETKPPTFSPIPQIPKDTPKQTLLVRGRVPMSRHGGMLVVTAKLHKDGASIPISFTGNYFAARATLAGRAIACEPVVHGDTYPSSWQAWRITVPASDRTGDWTLRVTAMLPRAVQIRWQSYFIPSDHP